MHGNSLLQERTRIRVFQNVHGNFPQKIPTSTTRTTRSGRISRANVPHTEKIYLNLRQQLKRKPEDKLEDLDVNTLILGNVYDFHSTSRTSSWKRLFGEFTCNQTSATKNSETIVPCDKKVGQKSDRNPRNICDRLARRFLEKDDSVDSAITYVFSDSVLSMGRISENPIKAW